MAKHAPLRTYADAYVSALTKKTDGVGELLEIQRVLYENPSIRSFISDGSIPLNDRKSALSIISPEADEKTHSFILILGEEGLLDALDRVIDRVRTSYGKLTGCEYVRITSAIELTKDERKRIEEAISKTEDREIRLECTVDPSIIGGLIIQRNDWILNSSIQGRLEHLKRLLNV